MQEVVNYLEQVTGCKAEVQENTVKVYPRKLEGLDINKVGSLNSKEWDGYVDYLSINRSNKGLVVIVITKED